MIVIDIDAGSCFYPFLLSSKIGIGSLVASPGRSALANRDRSCAPRSTRESAWLGAVG